MSGTVLVNLIIDRDGKPNRVRVVHGISPDLDQKALEAVESYRFKPAMNQGVPVTVELNVQVNFQIR